MLEERIRLIECFDRYRALLTEHQNDIMELYFLQDLSLGEIADETDVSRQAVHDVIRRTERILLDYEDKLRDVERAKRIRRILGAALENLGTDDPDRRDYGLRLLNKLYEER